MNFIKKLAIVTIIFLVAIHFMPAIDFPNTAGILAAVTFLFSVIYGFEISIVIANFSQLKTQLATENAQLLSIYHVAQMLGGVEGQETMDAVECYVMKAIDVPLKDHLMGTNKEFFEIFRPLKGMKEFGNQEQTTVGQYLTEALLYFPQSRNQVAEVAPKFIDSSVWVMLIILAIILIAVLFFGAGSDLLSTTVAAIFSATVVGSLFLLDEIDSNRIQEAHLEYAVFNETLESIGKLPYVPEIAIKKGIIKFKRGKQYRIGKFDKKSPLENRVVEVVG